MAFIERIETWRLPKLLVVRVTDSDGGQGWGQTAARAADVTQAALHSLVVPVALGLKTDPDQVTKAVWNTDYKMRGTFMARALTGVETALWDLAGKRQCRPVWHLLGGESLRDVPLYISCRTRKTTPEAEIERIEAEIALSGYRGIKVQIGNRLGRGSEGPEGRSEKLIDALRKAFPDHRLSADANGGYSVGDAIAIGRRMEGLGFHHFEEPCPFDDLAGTKAVADALELSVSGGEQDNDIGKFERMASGRVVDILQCDLAYCGGVTRTLEISRLAQTHGLPFMPHSPTMSMLQVFALHLLTALPASGEMHEWRGAADREAWAEELYTPLPVARNGVTRVTEKPGWGITVNLDRLKRADHRDFYHNSV